MNKRKKVLVIRNDKLGDFMLAWPAFSLLKKQYPECEITALVPEYTAPVAEQCEWIDKVLIDTHKKSFLNDIFSLSKIIKKNNFDVSISLFSEARTAIALWLAGIKVRVGPATKLAQLFLNKKLRQKRSLSLKPEYEYNLDLVKFYIQSNGDTSTSPCPAPYLKYDSKEIGTLKAHYLKLYKIPDNSKIIIIHPGTGGSAINLSLQQYADLAKMLSKNIPAFFIITAGPGEEENAEHLSTLLEIIPHCVHQSTGGIIEFCKFIGISDLFISGSTGPLHIAGALNIITAAFYPSRRSATSLRWQTLNDEHHRVSFTAPENEMSAINLNNSANEIVHLLNSTAIRQ